MKANRGRDTAPELELRRALTRMGLRYRLQIRPVPAVRARADLVFRGARVAVFVDGCFWHGCPTHGTWPRQNADFWRGKIEKNMDRDSENTKQLEEEGWTVVRVWEHEDMQWVAGRVADLVRERRR